MFVLLPKLLPSGTRDLERSLTMEHLANIHSALNTHRERVNIWLPRFKLDEGFNVNDALKKMGMKDMFSDKSDLSGMNGGKDLYVSQVIHKAFVEVNEEGSEAAAATVVVIKGRCTSASAPPEINFRADHPFLFFIREKATGFILFIGRLSSP